MTDNAEKARKPPPCRVCSDFQSWRKDAGKKVVDSKKNEVSCDPEQLKPCPEDRETLGRATWSFLHTMTAYYPDKPSDRKQREARQFMRLFSHFYPCDDCAEHLQVWMQDNPPEVQSRSTFSLWMCQAHNEVNVRLGKPEFDCSRVDERWRTGWKDGSCD